MNVKYLSIVLVAATAITLSLSFPLFAGEKDEIYTNWRGLAIKGYDPVAFHKDGKPIKGSGDYELIWKDATWRFASAAHRDLFNTDPLKYAPRYGGYCAWAVAQGSTASVDPQNAWRIVDGKLYLNYSVKVQKQWEEDIPGNIKKADANWPGVLN